MNYRKFTPKNYPNTAKHLEIFWEDMDKTLVPFIITLGMDWCKESKRHLWLVNSQLKGYDLPNEMFFETSDEAVAFVIKETKKFLKGSLEKLEKAE